MNHPHVTRSGIHPLHCNNPAGRPERYVRQTATWWEMLDFLIFFLQSRFHGTITGQNSFETTCRFFRRGSNRQPVHPLHTGLPRYGWKTSAMVHQQIGRLDIAPVGKNRSWSTPQGNTTIRAGSKPYSFMALTSTLWASQKKTVVCSSASLIAIHTSNSRSASHNRSNPQDMLTSGRNPLKATARATSFIPGRHAPDQSSIYPVTTAYGVRCGFFFCWLMDLPHIGR